MDRNKRNKRILCLSLCFALLLGLFSGCGGDKAATMHLEKTQGTVGVEDERDIRLEAREGMQLYSGYEVGTAQVSLAWIGLDRTKAVKLDEASTAEIMQSGKQLTVKLYEGKLFFDVSEPLQSDETFTIETATMITGIRGTCGWIEVVDEFTTRLTVLEGTVTVESRDPVTGETRLTTVTGGQILTVVYYGDSQGREDHAINGLISSNVIISDNIIHTDNGLRVEQLQENRVPPFVREEIQQSRELQDRIEEFSDLSLPEILEAPEFDEQPQPQDREEPQLQDREEPQPLPEEIVAPPETEPRETQPATDPPAEDPIPLETEVYYEEVTVEWWEAVPVDPEDSTVTPPGTAPTTPPGTDTNTPPAPPTPPTPGEAGGTAGEAAVPEPVTVTQYKPQIQLLPSASNPTYAIITQANEISETTFTKDPDTGEIIGTTTVKIQPIPGTATQTDDVTDGFVTFKDMDGKTVTLPVTAPPT